MIFLLLLFFLSTPLLAHAAISLQPTVTGLSSGNYRASAGTFTTAANSASYGATSVVRVGGKAITVPATLRMAANAGQFAKNAMKLNPYALAGTLAAGYLLDQLISWDEAGQTWTKAVPSGWVTVTGGQYQGCNQVGHSGRVFDSSTNDSWLRYPSGAHGCSGAYSGPGNLLGYCTDAAESCGYQALYAVPNATAPVDGAIPMTPGDWDALPDPLPFVAPELPHAPYMPQGVPVDAPSYDFAPFSAPVGDPYAKPDGSTAQPMASVSPNGDSVTIDTYDQPLTDTQGNPVPNTQPQDTPEPQPDPCQQNPGRIGCMDAGSDNFPVPTHTINFEFTPESNPLSGGCPAPINVLGHQISYQPACDAMGLIRPVVLGIASIIAAYILIGAFRGVE